VFFFLRMATLTTHGSSQLDRELLCFFLAWSCYTPGLDFFHILRAAILYDRVTVSFYFQLLSVFFCLRILAKCSLQNVSEIDHRGQFHQHVYKQISQKCKNSVKLSVCTFLGLRTKKQLAVKCCWNWLQKTSNIHWALGHGAVGCKFTHHNHFSAYLVRHFLSLGENSQNFLGKFVRFFVTLGLKILRLFRLKVLFEADIIKGWC